MTTESRDPLERERIARIFVDLAEQLSGESPNETAIGERAALLGNALWFGHSIELDLPRWRDENRQAKGGERQC